MRPLRLRNARGFTLIELLVVVAIIGLVAAATLPTIIPAIAHRQVISAASLLQTALASTRDAASRADASQGLRFFRDQALTTRPAVLAYSSWVPVAPGPEYAEGYVMVSVSTSTRAPASGTITGVTPITIYGPSVNPTNANPLPPTTWYWNIRRGEKIRINNEGPLYTIVGPMNTSGNNFVWDTATNPEGFINEGPPGTMPSGPGGTEMLFLTDGQDDNGNGYVDELYDGVDNDGFNGPDDLQEWEPETLGTLPASTTFFYPYQIIRRPAVTPRTRVTSLPANVVIDATTLYGTNERSRLPVDPSNLPYFDVMFAPNGQVLPNLSSAGTASLPRVPFYHFWLTERDGVVDPSATATAFPYLPMPPGTAGYTGTPLRGERRLVSINTRSGFVTVKQIEEGNFSTSNAGLPFQDAQNGQRDSQ